jgi:hypothetical protein
MDGIQVAGDARAHLHGVDGDEAADVLLLVRHHLLHRLSDGDLWRRRRGALGLRLLIATGERDRQQRQHEQKQGLAEFGHANRLG